MKKAEESIFKNHSKLTKNELRFRLIIYKYSTSKNLFSLVWNFTTLFIYSLVFGNQIRTKWEFIKNIFLSKSFLTEQSINSIDFRIELIRGGYKKDQMFSILAKDIKINEEENKPEYIKELEASTKKYVENATKLHNDFIKNSQTPPLKSESNISKIITKEKKTIENMFNSK